MLRAAKKAVVGSSCCSSTSNCLPLERAISAAAVVSRRWDSEQGEFGNQTPPTHLGGSLRAWLWPESGSVQNTGLGVRGLRSIAARPPSQRPGPKLRGFGRAGVPRRRPASLEGDQSAGRVYVHVEFGSERWMDARARLTSTTLVLRTRTIVDRGGSMIAVKNLACGVCIDKYGSLFVRLTLTQPSLPPP